MRRAALSLHRRLPQCRRVSSSGLFSLPYLATPASFPRAAAAAARACAPHVAAVCAFGSPPPPPAPPPPPVTPAAAVEVLRRLDAVSDTLCRVLDAAEAARSLSGSPHWRRSAEAAHGALSEYMYSLNGAVPLHGALVRVTGCARTMGALGGERRAVAAALRAEFERDGIGRPAAARARVAALQAETAQLSGEFCARAAGGAPAIVVLPRAALAELPPEALAAQPAGALAAGGGASVRLFAEPTLVAHGLRRSPRAEVRAALLRAAHGERRDNVETLEQLRRARRALAAAAGARSYADMVCGGGSRIAGGAHGAVDFLRKLARALLPYAAGECAALCGRAAAAAAASASAHAAAAAPPPPPLPPRDVRGAAAAAPHPLLALGRGASGGAPPVRALEAALCAHAGVRLEPWDVPFFSAAAGGAGDGAAAAAAAASEYLPLSAALRGLAEVMARVFGVRMARAALEPGEGWAGERGGGAEGLLRFDLASEGADGAPLGTLYLDAFSRAEKAGGAAHYVVRCGKRRHEFDGALDGELRRGGGAEGARGTGEAPPPPPPPPAGDGASGASSWQLPIVVLALNFAPPAGGLREWGAGGAGADAALRRALLSPGEAETLFHEWGHAVHSLLSRTEFQHLSGTRGALDFVEVPSHLFEHWAREWGAVAVWAAHWETGAPLPRGVWARVEAARARARASELLQMTAHALFDLALFASGDVVAAVLRGPPLGEGEARALAAAAAAGAPPALLPGTCVRGVELALSGGRGSPPQGGGGGAEEEEEEEEEEGVPSTALLQAVQERYVVAPSLPGSAWHGGFTHVCTYGAGFYSYLFASVISAALWQRHFAADPFCARAGELLRRELLAHGGAKEPAAMLRECLGADHASLLPLLRELEAPREGGGLM
jgi:intermediate peptidase